MEWGISTAEVVYGALAFLGGLVVSSAIVVIFLLLIAPDHFVAPQAALRRRFRSAPARVAYAVLKNALGAVLVVVGIVLSVPGVPGQGLLTILVGLVLLDIPGKRRLELKIVSRPRVVRAINRLRNRFGRPPLLTTLPDADPAGSDPPAAPR